MKTQRKTWENRGKDRKTVENMIKKTGENRGKHGKTKETEEKIGKRGKTR